MSFESVMPSNHLIPFSSCLQSFPAQGSFPVRRLFVSGGQRIGASASVLVLPMNIQGWFPSGRYGHRLFIYLSAHMLSHTHMCSHLHVRPCRLKLEGTQFSSRGLISHVSWRTDTYKRARAHTHTHTHTHTHSLILSFYFWLTLFSKFLIPVIHMIKLEQ